MEVEIPQVSKTAALWVSSKAKWDSYIAEEKTSQPASSQEYFKEDLEQEKHSKSKTIEFLIEANILPPDLKQIDADSEKIKEDESKVKQEI